MEPREKVEIEAGDAHYGIVGVALVLNRDVGESIPHEGKVVIR